MPLPFDSQEDDPETAQDTFTHGDSTADNNDDGRDFHLDAQAVTWKMTLVEMCGGVRVSYSRNSQRRN